MVSNLFRTQDLANNPTEAPIAFHSINGSWFSDFALTDDNFARAILATPNYGLVVLPNSKVGFDPVWQISEMALGDHLGAGFLRTVNGAADTSRHRWLCVLGDPTPRQNYLTAPNGLTATNSAGTVTLKWGAGESGSAYYIYRGSDRKGPFQRLTATTPPSPIGGTNATVTADSNTIYMVRGAKLVTTGSGSYMNLSQGCSSGARALPGATA